MTNISAYEIKGKDKKTKKDKKRFFVKCVIAFLLLSIVGTFVTTILLSEVKTTQYPEPSSLFFVEDYSGVFTEETESFIMTQAATLQNATKAQVVVVSVPNTQVDSLEDFSHELANKWGIGDANLDNGVLILFTTDEPHVRMEVGRGLEGCITDGRAGRILDEQAVDAKDSGRWNQAAINTWVSTAEAVYQEYGLEPPGDMKLVDKVNEQVTGPTMADVEFTEPLVEQNQDPIWLQIIVAFIAFWILAFIPFVIICFFIYNGIFNNYNGNGPGGGYYGGGYGGWGSSGGGGGFSGGGGSFGGGGASR